MISFKEQNKLLLDISKALKNRITTYAVGGTAMMFVGLKEYTKDIDLVFKNEEERAAFKEAAMILGFKEMDSRRVYTKDEVPEMIIRGDARIDMFIKDVVYFRLTGEMKNKSIDAVQFGDNLVIGIVDLHDIIMMKCATDRQKDKDDVKRISERTEINWDTLVEEAKNQLKHGKKRAVFELGCFLEDLKKDFDVEVPKEVLENLYELLPEKR